VEHVFAQGDLVVATVARPWRVDADGRPWVRYFLERILVEGEPVRLEPAHVPGVAVWLDGDGTRALTLDRAYVTQGDWPGYGVETTLTAIDIGDEVRVTSRLELASELVSLAPDARWIHAVRADAYHADTVEPAEVWDPPETELLSIDVSDRAHLRIASAQTLGNGYWWIAARIPSLLALSGGADNGLALFDLRPDPDRPHFDRFVRTLGWTTQILPADDVLYVVGGPYGIQVVEHEAGGVLDLGAAGEPGP
jgi:hypothetical protein